MLSVTRRSIPRLSRPALSALRYNSTVPPTKNEGTAAAAAGGEAVSPKITEIVDSISKLTILETSQLIAELKSKLNIPDVAPMMAASAMPQFGAGAAAVGGTPGEGDSETAGSGAAGAGAAEEKTTFAVKLESFDTKSKAKIIKEIKSMLGLSLVEAKKFVEGAPKVVKDNVSKADADTMKEALEKLGAKISLE